MNESHIFSRRGPFTHLPGIVKSKILSRRLHSKILTIVVLPWNPINTAMKMAVVTLNVLFRSGPAVGTKSRR